MNGQRMKRIAARHAPWPGPSPSACDVIHQHVREGLCHSLMNKLLGPSTVEILENRHAGPLASSLEFEARFGVLRSSSGVALWDESLVLPAILSAHDPPLWRFVPTLSKAAFGDITTYAKDNVHSLRVGTPVCLEDCGTKVRCRRKDSSRGRMRVLPNVDTIDMLYESKLRVSCSSKDGKPVCALRKHKPAGFTESKSTCWEKHVPHVPDPLICLVPNTKMVIRFSALEEEYLPLAKAMEEIKKGTERLKSVRHKKCTSVMIGELWRLDMKKVACWTVDESISRKSPRWFLENSPLNGTVPAGVPRANVTYEVELEMSTQKAERLFLQDMRQRNRSSRLRDFVESYVHNAQLLAMIPQEYTFGEG